ncbi:hypothetical protein P152DRAFT_157765 [Eremomyces bilateralis CBS 781.70]|uniref:Uncharacterized protein n=1 Tax=Eremomyces bilateralis CBS 781.70 TaxID=1392243 RepID=A0A6G1FUJ8_9PEZI|nr:uncharacterized protein P152DRAFT_157765 [Eremomyces bilateralis CBS 781.70]KAF1809454.1 hypothetical protein P152DRAFT_157765 [Eremomyces bilateralis CBS 781.70]
MDRGPSPWSAPLRHFPTSATSALPRSPISDARSPEPQPWAQGLVLASCIYTVANFLHHCLHFDKYQPHIIPIAFVAIVFFGSLTNQDIFLQLLPWALPCGLGASEVVYLLLSFWNAESCEVHSI